MEKQNFAWVRVENERTRRVIPVSTQKPEIPEAIQKKWQKIVDLVAYIMHVPTGLITRLSTKELEIFIASETSGNPYKKNDRDKLGIGMFCETVAGRREKMVITDISQSGYWRRNPHAKLGMQAYLGVPIQWDDGELFGTFCILDDKSNPFSGAFEDLILQFKEVIETDLKYLCLHEQMMKRLSNRELQLREAHHRIKNHFNLLISYLRIQSRKLDDNHEIQTVLKELQNRIHIISLIHDELHKSAGSAHIPLDQYIHRLCDYMVKNLADEDIRIHYHIDPMTLSPENSVSCGFILSELITNSIKHAFSDTEHPEIRICVKQANPNEIELCYHDNGTGLPEDYTMDRTQSVGTMLLSSMISQMEGTVRTENKNGACFQIALKLDETTA